MNSFRTCLQISQGLRKLPLIFLGENLITTYLLCHLHHIYNSTNIHSVKKKLFGKIFIKNENINLNLKKNSIIEGNFFYYSEGIVLSSILQQMQNVSTSELHR